MLSWKEMAKIIRFKTFYLVVILSLIGIILILGTPTLIQRESVFYEVTIALGVTLLTSATTSLLYEVFLRFEVEEFATMKLIEHLEESKAFEVRFRAANLVDAGINRGELDFKEIVANAKGFLKIIGLSIPDITEEACRSIMNEKLMKEQKFVVRILLLNPYSVLSFRRAQAQVYADPDSYYNKVLFTIGELKHFHHDLVKEGKVDPRRFDVKLYRAIPASSCVITQERAIITPYTVAQTGALSPYIVYENPRKGASPYSLYLRHFDSIWEASDSIFSRSLEDLKKETLEHERQILDKISSGRFSQN